MKNGLKGVNGGKWSNYWSIGTVIVIAKTLSDKRLDEKYGVLDFFFTNTIQ